jgi:hypothetical protein
LGKETTLTSTLYSAYSSVRAALFLHRTLRTLADPTPSSLSPEQEATAVSNMLSQDSRLAQELREQLERDQMDLKKGSLIVEGFKNPQQKGAQAKTVAGFPFE